MGLFDFLLGKKKPAANVEVAVDGPPTPAKPVGWPAIRSLAQAGEWDWDWGNAGAHRLARQALELALPTFSTEGKMAVIKEVPDDETIDLRGVHAGHPIRIAVWMSFGSFWRIEMRAPQLGGRFLHLQRDLEKIPKQVDPEDPWSAEEGVRTFVGRGVFFEGEEERVASQLVIWRQIPETTCDSLLARLERVQGDGLLYVGDGIQLLQTPGLDDLDDPAAYLHECAELLRQGLEAVQATEAAQTPAWEQTAQPVSREVCSYCSSRFLGTPGHPNCPNCGATPRG